MNRIKIFCIYCFIVLSQNLWAEVFFDYEREKLIAERLLARNVSGEVVTLKHGRYDIFSLYNAYLNDEKKGAVILLHPMAAHPDWPAVIRHLRENLPQYGWSTLSVQLPLLFPEEPISDYGQTLDEANKRIQAAVDCLSDLGYEDIMVVGYGFGSIYGLNVLKTEKQNPGIVGLVGIGLRPHPYLNPKFNVIKTLEKFQVPLLDIYASEDNELVIQSAADRRLAARKADNSFYKQIEMGGADPQFTDQSDILVKRIVAWMNELIDKVSLRQDNDNLDEN